MMRRRTNAKGDPNRNLQLRDGEVQFEPANVFPDGTPAAYSTPGLSAWTPPPDGLTGQTDRTREAGPALPPALTRGAGMVQLSINGRGGMGSAWAWLTRDELSEWIEHLAEVRDRLPAGGDA